jgi:hypothetical protein
MIRTLSFVSSTALVAALLVGVVGPAAATDQVVNGTGVVHAGYYPEDVFKAGGVLDPAFNDMGAHAAVTGHRVSLGGTFDDVTVPTNADWEVPGKYNGTILQLNELWSGGSTPWVNLTFGTGGSTAEVAAGTMDADISRWAGYVKRWLDGENLRPTTVPTAGRSVIIAPFPEMNWSGGFPYQCQPSTFAAAYNHVVAVVEAELGPTFKEKVRWAFAANNGSGVNCGTIASYYPGPTNVDFMAFSGYNQFGAGGPNDSPSQVMGEALAALKGLAPTKPIIVAQTAACTTNGTRPTWIADMVSLLRDDANVLGFLWFNKNNSGQGATECDWRIWNGTTADAAWDTALDGASYVHPIAEWFVPGTTLVVGGLADTPDLCPAGKTCDSVSLIDATGPNFNNRLRATEQAPINRFIYGNPGDFPLMGDWNCDGIDTPGQYRQSDGFVYLTDVNGPSVANRQFFLGNPGDVPIAGDFNGNGCDTVSIYRPGTQEFFISNTLANNNQGIVADFPGYVFGNPGDKPFSGDLDGDNVDEVALHRESTGLVYYRLTLTTGNADTQFIFGDPNDIIEAGDWNGDGTDTVAVYRPSNGKVYLKLANVQGNADASFFGGSSMIGFGTAPRTP